MHWYWKQNILLLTAGFTKLWNTEATRKPDLVIKHLPMSSEMLFKQCFVVTESIYCAENFLCMLNWTATGNEWKFNYLIIPRYHFQKAFFPHHSDTLGIGTFFFQNTTPTTISQCGIETGSVLTIERKKISNKLWNIFRETIDLD